MAAIASDLRITGLSVRDTGQESAHPGDGVHPTQVQDPDMSALGSLVPIHPVGVGAYTVPTDVPHSDGTLARKSTTLVPVRVDAGGTSGIVFTYADTATALLVQHKRSSMLHGRDAIAINARRRVREQLSDWSSHSEQAKRPLQQVFLLSGYIEQRDAEQPFPRLVCSTIVHGHRQHESAMKVDAESAVLHKLGLDFLVLDSGCCGMASPFGSTRIEARNFAFDRLIEGVLHQITLEVPCRL